jgi:hypothetical protein
MTRTKKGFDAVAMMRSIRDEVSANIDGMTLEQEPAWLASQELSDPFLRRLRDGAAQPGTRGGLGSELRPWQSSADDVAQCYEAT